ncbi:DUF2490 domain-containing protein [Mucilaginibacter sp. HD30]
MKRIFTVAFLLFMYHTVCAQRNSHNLFWGRLALADTLNSKIKWEVFLQKRTQNNYAGDPNIFNSDQFKSYWFWFHYTLNKNVKLSVSPFGYFESFVLNNSKPDAAIPPIKEFRWAGRIEHETKGKLFNYSNRYNLEYRLRDLKNNGEYLSNWRVRYMIRLDKPVLNVLSKTKPVTFTVYDEVFLQFGDAVKNNPNVFDQNRIYAGASYEVVRNIKFSLGYIYGFQARNSGKEFDDINTYWAILTFDNLISQFKRR